MGTEFQSSKMKVVLQRMGRGSCKTVWKTSMPLDCVLTNDQGGTFITCVFYSN